MSAIELEPVALTAKAFEAFGEVIEAVGDCRLINRGTTRQFADLARLDVTAGGGRPHLSIYRATPQEPPIAIRMLERHPLSSQLFMPLDRRCFLVIVAAGREPVDPSAVRAFLTNGRQGVNYHRGTWHHPLIALGQETDFLVFDRAGGGQNCEEVHFDAGTEIAVKL